MIEGVFFGFVALFLLAIELARRSDRDRYRLWRRGKFIGPPTDGNCVSEEDVVLAVPKGVAREVVEAAFTTGGARHTSVEQWPGWVKGWTRCYLGMFGFQWGVYPAKLEDGRVVVHCVVRPRNSTQWVDPFGRVRRSQQQLVTALREQARQAAVMRGPSAA